MTNQTSSGDLSALLGRVQELENENRKMKRVGALILVAMAALILMGQAGKNRALDANSLVIRDSRGNVRIELGTTEGDSPFLRMFANSQAFPSLVLLSEQKGSSLTFLPTGSATAMHLSTTDSPSLSLINGAGDTTIGVASVHLQDSDKFRADLGIMDTLNPKTGAATKTSAASLILFGKDGKVIWQAP